MNILDDNSESVLLKEIPFGKILLYGMIVPIGMTFFIFQYLFEGDIQFTPLNPLFI